MTYPHPDHPEPGDPRDTTPLIPHVTELPAVGPLDRATGILAAVPELRRQLIRAAWTGEVPLAAGMICALGLLHDAEDTHHLASSAGIANRDDLPDGAEDGVRAWLGLNSERILGPAVYYRATVNVTTGEIRVHVPGTDGLPFGPDDGPAAGRLTRIHVAPWAADEGGLARADEALARDWRIHDTWRTGDGPHGHVWETVVVPTTARPADAPDTPVGG